MIQYVYRGGNYREFRGHVFLGGKPTTIRDSGTMEAIKRERDFELVKGGDPVEKEVEGKGQRQVLGLPRHPRRQEPRK